MKRTLLLMLAFLFTLAGSAHAQTQIKQNPVITVDQSGSMTLPLEAQQSSKMLCDFLRLGIVKTKFELNSVRTDCVMVNLSFKPQDNTAISMGQGSIRLKQGVNPIGIYIPPIGKPNTLSGPRTTKQLIDDGYIVIDRPQLDQPIPLEEKISFITDLLAERFKMQTVVSRRSYVVTESEMPIVIRGGEWFGFGQENLFGALIRAIDIAEAHPHADAATLLSLVRQSSEPSGGFMTDGGTPPGGDVRRDSSNTTPVGPELCAELLTYTFYEVGPWYSDLAIEKISHKASGVDVVWDRVIWKRDITTITHYGSCYLEKGHGGPHRAKIARTSRTTTTIEEPVEYPPDAPHEPPRDHGSDKLPTK